MQKTDRRVQWILILAMLAGCLYIFHTYLFGADLFVFGDNGSDTKEQYLMQYNTIVNHLRAGDFSFWDFNYGLGTNLFMLNLADPFLMLLYGAGALFGAEYLPYYLVYYHILKILLAGWICYRYLSCFPLSERVKGLCALIYAFCGYLLVWGQHYQFSTAVIFYPLVLWMAEKTLKNWRWGFGLSLACALSVFSSLYLSYMTLLASGIYVCFRVLWMEEGGVKKGVVRLFVTAGFMLLGVGMGCAMLLPSAAVIFGVTGRVESEGSFLSRMASMVNFYEPEYYVTLLGRFLSSSFQGNGASWSGSNNYYEAPNVYCTALLIILGFQYAAGFPSQKTSRRRKGIQIAAGILVLLLFALRIASAAFNGFAYPFSRHTFVVIPIFLLLMAFTLERIIREKKVSVPALILALALLCLGYAKGALAAATPQLKRNLVILLAMALLMGISLLLHRRRRKQTGAYLCLCFAVAASLFSDGACVNQNRVTLRKDADSYFDQLYGDSIQEAQAWLEERDPEFFRTEKMFNIGSLCMDSLAQGYSPISTYNSMMNSDVLEFAKMIWPGLLFVDDNHFYFQNVKQDTTKMTLLGVKYLLAREGDLKIPGFAMIQEFENLYVYENQDNASIGKFYTASMTQAAYEENREELDGNRLLTQAVILDEEGEHDKTRELLDSCQREEINGAVKKAKWKVSGKEKMTIPLKSKKLAGYEQVSASFVLRVDQDTHFGITTAEGAYYESDVKGGKDLYIELTLPAGTENIQIDFRAGKVKASVKQLQVYGNRSMPTYSKEGQVQVLRQEKDDLLTGTLHAPQDGIVLLAVPYEQGWSLKVDGKETEILQADYGLTGFYVSEGEHSFSLEFTPPLLKAGIGVSLASMAAYLLLLCGMLYRRKKQEKAGGMKSLSEQGE